MVNVNKNSKKSYFSNKNVKEAILFFLLAVALLIYSLVNHYGSTSLKWNMSPYLFPTLISIFIGMLSISLAFEGIKEIKANKKNVPKANILWKNVLFTIVASIIYFILMDIISFIPATILFLVSMLLYLGERRIWLIVLISVGVTTIIYVLFGVLLHVMLP